MGHPRACGENLDAVPPKGGGSRAIPARAGRTGQGARQGGPASRAIPARAGRTALAQSWTVRPAGPSPRVRGELRDAIAGQGRGRAIPARAGRTLPERGSRPGERRAIPARAGRTPTASRRVRRTYGPSPRVRGERSRSSSGPWSTKGHPRACGENGRSPSDGHSRGRAIPARAGRTLHNGEMSGQFFRAIPARAGRTLDKYRCFAR